MPILPTTRQKRIEGHSPHGKTIERSLTHAFATFTHAADSLENSYRQLQMEVSHVRTELEIANRDLARSLTDNQNMRAFLERILESLPCGVVVLDESGNLQRINPEARRVLCVGPNSTGSDAKPSNLPQTWICEEDSFSKPGVEWDWTIEHAEGPLTVAVTRTVLAEGSNSGKQFVFILRDTTSEKQLQREREAARRLQALAEMSTVLAHEIRNPLASLELFAGLLAETTASDSDRRRWVGQVQAGLRVLSATVNNVLQLHSTVPPQSMPVRIGRLLGETVEFLRPLARQWETRIEFVKPADDVCILGEPHCLQQVFLNLAINAFRSMAPKGCLRISTGRSEHDDCRVVDIEFQDQGKGIAAVNLARIFEPGFSTSLDSPGLGLAVSKRIIEQHGGSISVRSVPNYGSTFAIHLPVTGENS